MTNDLSSFARARRQLIHTAGSVALLGAGSLAARTLDQQYVDALKSGGTIVLIRHAQTVSGIGDPPGMRLDDCSTQRDLSDAGYAQSRRFGQWFVKHQLRPAAVKSSQWCRCLNTARAAFDQKNFGTALPVEPWIALNSFFQGHGNRDRQLAEAARAARELAEQKASGQFEVWVSHQVVISSLTGHYLGMGEMIVARHAAVGKPFEVLAKGIAF
jgi:broad specificity phosphatase PhoE